MPQNDELQEMLVSCKPRERGCQKLLKNPGLLFLGLLIKHCLNFLRGRQNLAKEFFQYETANWWQTQEEER